MATFDGLFDPAKVAEKRRLDSEKREALARIKAWAEELLPSPKFQDHDVGLPVDWSVKATSSGAVPEVGVPTKSATGGWGAVGSTTT